jgi:lysophospholipase L1-like esterase
MRRSNGLLHKMLICLLLSFLLTSSIIAQETTPFVINSGVGGNNTKDLLARIDTDCISYKPDLTVLMVGTNDMNSVKYVPLDQYKANLEKIIDILLKAKSKVLLTNILPLYEPYLLTRHPKSFYAPEGPAGRLEAVNKVIVQVAKEKHVSFLNVHHIFVTIGNIGLDESSYIRNMANSKMTDGIHPTPDGYRAIAIAVYEKIINDNLPHKRVVCFGDSITKGDGSTDNKSYPAYLKKLLLDDVEEML